jgi:hypothetical protein
MPACILLLSLLCAGVTAEAQHKSPGSVEKVIAQFPVVGLSLSRHALSAGDTVVATFAAYLDCTNQITRIDTLFDDAASPPAVVVRLFGTVYAGKGPRPLCASRLTRQRVTLRFPRSGAWIVEAAQPHSPVSLRDTLVIR